MAGRRTIEEWAEASKMPPLAFILDRTVPREVLMDDAPKVFGWQVAGKKAGFSPEEIEAMLEAGRAAQREHIARLEADPKWQTIAQRLGARPGLAARAIESEVPEDFALRDIWARKKAIAQGWSREPGDEA